MLNAIKSILLILIILFTGCGSESKIKSNSTTNSEPIKLKSDPDIKFLFPEQFGADFDFTAEIIKKPNTYYAVNQIKASFIFKVISVNGENLKDPIVIFPTELFPKNFKIGSIQNLRGYEFLQEIGQVQIKEEIVQMNLSYSSRMVILEPLKEEYKKIEVKIDKPLSNVKKEYSNGVYLSFPEQFGSDFEFTAELIRKSNSDYEQNIVKNPYKFKVLIVNGVKLSNPVIIEPVIKNAENYKIGEILNLRGFEKLKELGMPIIRGSDEKVKMQSMNLHYINQLIVTEIVNKK